MSPEQLEMLAIGVRERFRLPKASYDGFVWRNFLEPALIASTGDRISAEALLNQIRRCFVVGGAGTGKSTLLAWLSLTHSQNFLQQREHECPIFLSARNLVGAEPGEGDLFASIARAATEYARTLILPKDIDRAFQSQRLALLIDGVDEISDLDTRYAFLVELNRVTRRYPDSCVIVTTRPAGLTLSFSGFSFISLQSLDEDQVIRYALSYVQDDDGSSAFASRLVAQLRGVAGLARTPLFMGLLIDLYVHRGNIPDNLSSLYTDFTDYLLSTWEEQRGGEERSRFTLEQKNQALSLIAMHLLQEHRTAALHSDMCHWIQPVTKHRERMLNELAATGLLLETAQQPQTLAFGHQSFQDFYAAVALREDPYRLADLVRNDSMHQVLVFACGLVDDVGPIVEAAVERGQLLLAAKCISLGRHTSDHLFDYVARKFAEEIGEAFLSKLSRRYNANTPSPDMDVYAELLSAWDSFREAKLPSHMKGKVFEDFAARLFGIPFRVVSRNMRTERGEFDMVLEVTKGEPFWIEFGGDIMVECKNWSTATPLKDAATFAHKVNQSRVKLGFLCSISGFTADARQAINGISSNPSSPLIVPIDGMQIRDALLQRVDLEQFFKERIRSVKYLRRY